MVYFTLKPASTAAWPAATRRWLLTLSRECPPRSGCIEAMVSEAWAIRASVQQVSEQDGLVAAWAGATGTEGPAEAVALGAALLAQEALAARGAFVDRVGDECSSPSGIGGQRVEGGRPCGHV